MLKNDGQNDDRIGPRLSHNGDTIIKNVIKNNKSPRPGDSPRYPVFLQPTSSRKVRATERHVVNRSGIRAEIAWNRLDPAWRGLAFFLQRSLVYSGLRWCGQKKYIPLFFTHFIFDSDLDPSIELYRRDAGGDHDGFGQTALFLAPWDNFF